MWTQEDVELYRHFQKSPIFFIQKTWKLKPQTIKKEYQELVYKLVEEKQFKEIKVEFFEEFKKGKEITWQQWIILLLVENALSSKGKNKISVSSGHGIGKSVVLSWLIIWYLFCFKNAQVPCTAPTSEQMNDILWKELAYWLRKMPKALQSFFELSANYLRIKESPETWFARAKTARKENPEALAGVHSDYVLIIADEASGIAEEIYKTAEGAMTGKNVIVILISNPTRLIGYFYDTFNSDREAWENMQFSSNDSPIVEKDFVTRIQSKYGEESDEYNIRVLGKFPKEDAVDDQGYVPLLVESDIKQISDMAFVGEPLMGVDPAGEGRDETIWVVRDRFKAKIVCREKISNSKSIAQKTITLMEYYSVKSENIYIDNFGVGANVAQEIGIAGFRVNGINVGNNAYDDRFSNIRAQAYWGIKDWIRTGGEFIQDENWKELLFIRYRNTLGGKIQMMAKVDMKKKLGKSPDYADALSLTFIRPAQSHINREVRRIKREKIKQTFRLKMA